MPSKEFSFYRRTRIRKDRRLTKVILKKTHNQDLLLYKISKSNGAYKIS
jgi:hypothetical protein